MPDSVRPRRRVAAFVGAASPLVYGTVTVGAVLDAESSKLETIAETMAGVALVMVLLWLAHTYAQLTAARVEQGRHLTPRLIRQTMLHEAPVLTGGAVPLLAVGIASAAGSSFNAALSAGIWTSVAMLVVINLVAGVEARLSGAALVLQTAIGIFLGLGIIVMKLIFH